MGAKQHTLIDLNPSFANGRIGLRLALLVARLRLERTLDDG
jgi:hypothetical protein